MSGGSRSSSRSGKGGGAIVLVDATDSSLTVSWPAIPGASKYNLQFRPSTGSTDRGHDSGGELQYTTLSSGLTSTQARKRNLTGAGNGYWFRVSISKEGQAKIDKETLAYIGHTEPYKCLTMREQEQRMDPPVATPPNGPDSSSVVTWRAVSDATGYELQMRENDGGIPWSTIAPCLSGTEVRKKNLTSKNGYMFRVRPVFGGGDQSAFSSPSEVRFAPVLSDGVRSLFRCLEKGTLLRNPGRNAVSVADALAGKDLILLYASAHWCGPCRQFTPQLTHFYNDAKRSGHAIEVVFLSADHDDAGFRNYFATMPWLAVDFDDDGREALLSHIRVTGIPRLVVLDGRTGRIVESNAVGKPLDVQRMKGLLK